MGRPCSSSTLTKSGVGRGLPTIPLCASPSTGTMEVGAGADGAGPVLSAEQPVRMSIATNVGNARTHLREASTESRRIERDRSKE